MKKFYALGTYSPESYQAFIENPDQDRKTVVQELAKSMGGNVLSLEFLRGPFDFIVTAELETFEDMAAIKLAVEASGACEVDIFETVDINDIARKAGKALSNYSPPSS